MKNHTHSSLTAVFISFFFLLVLIVQVKPLQGQLWLEEKILPEVPGFPFVLDSYAKAGSSVSIDGFHAIVGVPYSDSFFSNGGMALIYEWDGSAWVQAQGLFPSDGAAYDEFGYSVAISGTTALVGSRFGDGNAGNSGAAYIFEKTGDAWNQVAKLTVSNGAYADDFGSSVSISGGTAIVGASSNDDNGSGSGAAYVFEKPAGGWSDTTETVKLSPSDPSASVRFGKSVSISDSTAIVGAYYGNGNVNTSGAAYLFKRSGGAWSQVAKIKASDGAAYDNFGWSVSISDSIAVVGAYLDDDNGGGSGSAYIFEITGGAWTQVDKLTPSDGTGVDYFGYSVSVSDSTVVIGAYRDDDSGSDSGSAYIFNKDAGPWTQVAKFTASDGVTGDYFGLSVSISGTMALVGAPHDDDKGSDSGSSYLFEKPLGGWSDTTETEKLPTFEGIENKTFARAVSISDSTVVVGSQIENGTVYIFEKAGGSWIQTAKLTASDAVNGDNFGWSVTNSGSTVIVGANNQFNNGIQTGAAYVFDEPATGWADATETAKLTASDGGWNDGFGWSVAISDSTVIIGAPGDDTNGPLSGAAYVFEKPITGWTDTTETAKLTPYSGGGYFGHSVSISGSKAIVGSINDVVNGISSGSASVFVKISGSWYQLAKLTSSNASNGDKFGSSVSISGNTSIIGAENSNFQRGQAYIFEEISGTWVQKAILIASDASYNDKFGGCVSISGDRAIVGASGNDINGSDSGSVYRFEKPPTGWANMTETAKILASDGAASDLFGGSVSTSDSTIIVGAHLDDDVGLNSGSAYIFHKSLIPVAKCRDHTAYLDGGGNVTVFPDSIDNGSLATAGIDSLSLSISDFACSDIGNNSVVLTVTDLNSATSTCSATVAVQDTVPPSVICQNAVVQLDTTGQSSIVNTEIDNGSNDACGILNMSINASDFTCFDTGDNSVILTVFDNNGNSSTCEATVTVQDLVPPPTPSCMDVTVQLDDLGQVSIISSQVDSNTSSGTAYVFEKPDTGWADMTELFKLVAADATPSDKFGWSVSVSGTTAIVGAYEDDDYGTLSGSAYIFEVNGGTWVRTAKLTASDAAPSDNFGFSVSVYGTTAVVGARHGDGIIDDSGAVYVFEKNGTSWDEAAKLEASDGAAFDGFGNSVSISGPTIIVGARGDDDSGANSGSAYVFENNGNGWIQKGKLLASDGSVGDAFGNAVSVSDSTVVIGAFEDDDSGANSGSAYIFEKPVSGWTSMSESAKLLALDGSTDDNFAGEVSISATLALIGALGDDDNGSSSGSAYVFEKLGNYWIQVSKLKASDGTTNDFFGRSVSISDTTAVVGAHGDDDSGSFSGSAYIFEKPANGWTDATETAKLSASDGNGGDYFGISVAISDSKVVVGAYGHGYNWQNDNCGIASETLDIANFTCSNIGANTVTLTVSDVNNNTSTCLAIVTVQDTVSPTTLCHDIMVPLDATGNLVITPNDVDNGSGDACGIAGMSLDVSSFNCSDVGDQTVHLTITDNNGNSSLCSAVVTVAPPGALCQDLTVQLDASGNASIVPDDVDNGTSDACGIAGMTLDTTTFSCIDIGSNTVTLTVSDNNGNQSNCTASVTVEDTIPPVAAAQDITVQLQAPTGTASIGAMEINNGSFDNCSIEIVTLDKYNFSCSDLGVQAVILTVIDSSGHADVDTAQVTVESNLTANIFYVDSSASGSATGLDWTNAFPSLWQALNTTCVTGGDTIQMARGTYIPGGSDRDSAFIFSGTSHVEGGYPTGGGVRDIAAHPTIISGDMGFPGDTTDNAFHAVVIDANASDVMISGVTISGGNANGVHQYASEGAGVLCLGIAHMDQVMITKNSSSGEGCAIKVIGGGNLTITNSTCSGNYSGVGIELAVDTSSTLLIDQDVLIEN